MGIDERKQREKANRRLHILEQAKELILDRGLNGFSLRDVAAAAELSKATLYLYFKNKDDLLAGILDGALGEFVRYVDERIPSEATGIEAVRALWMAYIDFFGESQDIFVLIGIKNHLDPLFPFSMDDSISGPDRPHHRLLITISSVLERGIRDRTIDPSLDPPLVARTVVLIASAIVDQIARLPRSRRDSRLIIKELRNTFALLIRGVAAPGTQRSLLTLP